MFSFAIHWRGFSVFIFESRRDRELWAYKYLSKQGDKHIIFMWKESIFRHISINISAFLILSTWEEINNVRQKTIRMKVISIQQRHNHWFHWMPQKQKKHNCTKGENANNPTKVWFMHTALEFFVSFFGPIKADSGTKRNI